MRSAYKISVETLQGEEDNIQIILKQCIWRCRMSLIKTGYGAVAESFKTKIKFWV
jgi:hypothetical protein